MQASDLVRAIDAPSRASGSIACTQRLQKPMPLVQAQSFDADAETFGGFRRAQMTIHGRLILSTITPCRSSPGNGSIAICRHLLTGGRDCFPPNPDFGSVRSRARSIPPERPVGSAQFNRVISPYPPAPAGMSGLKEIALQAAARPGLYPSQNFSSAASPVRWPSCQVSSSSRPCQAVLSVAWAVTYWRQRYSWKMAMMFSA